ncbi:hypothetical protein WSM22_35410 [Cytophagales bacterium WSM2-2]|nr:hypothetical protein WSM22_35410 [Cytophagales bacterium WSM2-2]
MNKLILLVFGVFSATGLQAQETASFNLTLNHAAISVKDVNQSAEFYRDVLKFQEITNRTKKEGIRWFSLGEGKELHLISTVKENVSLNKAVHLAFTTTNFDTFVKTIEKKNIVYFDWEGARNKVSVRADGIRQIFFQDPDGYWIEVNSVAQQK